jgi:hypothetical protein
MTSASQKLDANTEKGGGKAYVGAVIKNLLRLVRRPALNGQILSLRLLAAKPRSKRGGFQKLS